jgi:hypothetical protein
MTGHPPPVHPANPSKREPKRDIDIARTSRKTEASRCRGLDGRRWPGEAGSLKRYAGFGASLPRGEAGLATLYNHVTQTSRRAKLEYSCNGILNSVVALYVGRGTDLDTASRGC